MKKKSGGKKGTAKLTPEQQKAVFEKWKLSKEYRLLSELSDIIGDNKDPRDRDAEEMEDDFTFPFKLFLVRFQQWLDEMKVPKRSKSILMDYIEPFDQAILRTFYFQNRKPNYICNGKPGEFDRAVGIDSLHMKDSFCPILTFIKSKNELNETDYQSKLHI